MTPPAQPAHQRDGAALAHIPHARRGDEATIISVVDHWMRMLVLRASIALHREALLVVAAYARVVSGYKAKRMKEGEQSADESEDTPLDDEGEDILAAEQLCFKFTEQDYTGRALKAFRRRRRYLQETLVERGRHGLLPARRKPIAWKTAETILSASVEGML